MKTFSKDSNRDFTILNLTDTQLWNTEWEEGHICRNILEHTATELIERTKPDLITISGDIAWADHELSYDMFAEFIDKFNIPWAPVWGNHDNQDGAAVIDKIATRYMTHKNCVYEKGDKALGNGNYVICIEEDGVPVEAVFMMDSHDRVEYTDKDGNTSLKYAKLTQEQIDWYKNEINILKQRGCKDAMIITHIPIFAYNLASQAAYKNGIELKSITVKESEGEYCWNDGYTDSIGVQYEEIASHPEDDGVLDAIKGTEITKHIIVGHDHVNNWMITYEGVRMIFALKTGAGCYFYPTLNGGTVIKINREGVSDVYHEYVNVDHILPFHLHEKAKAVSMFSKASWRKHP